ncbi:hypothetical protein AQ765_23505 [Burkholderia pseudomallei]|nr:hypothetical protein AQ765_23505 [Burkholderia pseudomallei]
MRVARRRSRDVDRAATGRARVKAGERRWRGGTCRPFGPMRGVRAGSASRISSTSRQGARPAPSRRIDGAPRARRASRAALRCSGGARHSIRFGLRTFGSTGAS